MYGSMPYTKHIFNILTSNSRVIFDNSYNHIKSFLRRQFFGVTFSVFGAIFGAIFGATFSVLEGTFWGTLSSILLMGSTKATSSTSKLFSNIGLLQPTSFLLQVLLNTLIDYRMVLPVVLAKAG